MEKRIKYLESLLPKTVKDLSGNVVSIEVKYGSNFEKYACYEGNGVYQWKGLRANDTCILFLMGVLRSENIEFKQE